jgi:lysophospholipase L1-like esterase
MIRTAAAVALSPLLLARALRVRARTPRLPESSGARQGCAGHGMPLSLLILGDSAAAGLGAAHRNEASSGALVRALAPDFALEWELRTAAGFGVEAVSSLIDDGARGFDVALLAVGVNDVTSVQRLTRWIDSLRALIARLIMARDGFHPGPAAFALWAEAAAARIQAHFRGAASASRAEVTRV